MKAKNMPSRVVENLHYFNLLLDSHGAQRKALLMTVSNDQLNFISELLHNILYVMPLTDKERRTLHRRKYLIEIAKINRSYNYRRQRVKQRASQILKLLDEFHTELRAVAN